MTPSSFRRLRIRLALAVSFALAPFAIGAAEEADDTAPPPPATLTPPAKKKTPPPAAEGEEAPAKPPVKKKKAAPPPAEEGGEEAPPPPVKKKAAPPPAEEGSEETPAEEGGEEAPAEEGGEEGSEGAAAKPVPGEKVLADFEEADGKFKGLTARDSATADAVAAHAAHGAKSCHLKFPDPPGKASMRLALVPLDAKDWSKFKYFQLNAFNPGAAPADLLLRVFDGTNMTSCTVTLPPKGAQAVKVPVSTFSARSDISTLGLFSITVRKGVTELYIDYIRLTPSDDGAPATAVKNVSSGEKKQKGSPPVAKKAPPAEEGSEEEPAAKPPAKKKAPPPEEGAEEGGTEAPPAGEGGESGEGPAAKKAPRKEGIPPDADEVDPSAPSMEIVKGGAKKKAPPAEGGEEAPAAKKKAPPAEGGEEAPAAKPPAKKKKAPVAPPTEEEPPPATKKPPSDWVE